MKILSLDTTSMLGSIALSEGERLIAQEQQGVPGTHSGRLLVSIEHLMKIAGWKNADIEAVAVAAGPGSFTGLRVGLATAKGFAMALGCRIVGVSSLESLALNGSDFPGTVVTLVDARRGEIYAAPWRVPLAGRPKVVFKECVLPPQALIEKLKKIKGGLLLVGDGALAFEKDLLRALKKKAALARGTQCLPQAANLAMLALPRLTRKKGDDINALVPNYIRHSDAEIGFLGRKK